MAAYGFSDTLSDIVGAGIEYIWVKCTGDVAYYPVGDIADGNIVVETLAQANSFRNDRPFAFNLNVGAKMLGTPAAVIGGLNLLAIADNFQVKTRSGKYLKFPGGLKWKFVVGSDYDGYRYLELGLDRRFVIAHASLLDFADVVTSSPDAQGTPTVTDTLYAPLLTNPGAPVAAGFSDFQIRAVGETNWETMGVIRNAKFTAELLTEKDSLGCSRGYNVKYDIEVDAMQTSAELGLFSTAASEQPDFKITLADGMIFTFANNIGFQFSYHNERDSDGIAYVHVTAGGITDLTTFDGLIS